MKLRITLLALAFIPTAGLMAQQSIPTAFLTCISASGSGSPCQLQAGTYAVNAPLIINRSNVSVQGVGTVNLIRSSGYYNQIMQVGQCGMTGSLTGIQISHLTFNGMLKGLSDSNTEPSQTINHVVSGTVVPCPSTQNGPYYLTAELVLAGTQSFSSYPTDPTPPWTTNASVLVTDCTFLNTTFAAIYVDYSAQGALIKNINILASENTYTSDYSGLHGLTNISSGNVNGNRVGPAYYGIIVDGPQNAPVSATSCPSTPAAQYTVIDGAYIVNSGTNAVITNTPHVHVINSAFVSNHWAYLFSSAGSQLDFQSCSNDVLAQSNQLLDGGHGTDGTNLGAAHGWAASGVEMYGNNLTLTDNFISGNTGAAVTAFDASNVTISQSNPSNSYYYSNNNTLTGGASPAILFAAFNYYYNANGTKNYRLTVNNLTAVYGHAWGVEFQNRTGSPWGSYQASPFSHTYVTGNYFCNNQNSTNGSVDYSTGLFSDWAGYPAVPPGFGSSIGGNTTSGCPH